VSTQSENPAVQLQTPPEHTKRGPQGRLQPPQCWVLLVMSTQLAPHAVRFAPQSLPQVPAEHTSALLHPMPHVPQLAGSEDRSTHAPAQSSKPVAHEQWPPEQRA
jgi:hypothetical protein